MHTVDRESPLWEYLTKELRALVEDGERLMTFVDEHGERAGITDFSFLVFSFAKAYEGFLKKILLDVGYLKHDEYYGDEMRIGRILNPSYKKEKQSIYEALCGSSAKRKDLTLRMWGMWKKGRNTVFHYFPHNFKRLKHEEAVKIVEEFVAVMQAVVKHCDVVVETLANDKKGKKRKRF